MNWRKILQWLLALFMLYLIFEILRTLFGGSLGTEELIIGLLVANLGYSFHTHSLVVEHLEWHKGKYTH